MRQILINSYLHEMNGGTLNTTGRSARWGIACLVLLAWVAVSTDRPAPGGGPERAEASDHPVPEKPEKPSVPTYAKEVSRIIQKNCQECHRKGQVAPFPLETYEHAHKRAQDIATVTDERSMPPWKAAPGIGPKYQHDRSLSAADIATFAAWADAGAPLGDPADLPPPARFPDGWTLGTPDVVIELPEDFPIPATGSDIYRCFVIPTDLPEDVYLTAAEYRPGNRRVVHHMLAYVDITREGRQKDASDPGPGYECFGGPEVKIHAGLGGWAPGNEPCRLPVGVGWSLPKGADVIVQVHYHPDGKPETDRSRIGLHLARKPIKQTSHWAVALNRDLEIPPGASNHEVKAEWRVPVNVVAYAVLPHMHQLGRDMTISLTYPDGRKQDLIRIDDWDFSWQNTYAFDQPLDVPKGSVLHVVAHYDNSAGNPRNPNRPPKLVKWGEATTDEMCIGFLTVTKKGQDLTRHGEKDDLQDILAAQRKDEMERHQQAAKERAAEAKARAKAGQGE
jgi:Copper type II ascorbate-dependent monooxygenase, C-terminal domain